MKARSIDMSSETTTETEENKEIVGQDVTQNIDSQKQNETLSSIGSGEANANQNVDSEENEMDLDNIAENLYVTDDQIIEESVIEGNTYNMNGLDIGILSISGVFLIFTIIFLINFIKHQQKPKNKMSK